MVKSRGFYKYSLFVTLRSCVSRSTPTDLLVTEFKYLLEIEGSGRVWYDGVQHVISVNHYPEQRHTVYFTQAGKTNRED